MLYSFQWALVTREEIILKGRWFSQVFLSWLVWNTSLLLYQSTKLFLPSLEVKQYVGVLGKRDNEDNILICFHNCDFVACVAADGVSAIFIMAKWLMERQEPKWEIQF